MPDPETTDATPSMQLISYQVGEVKGLVQGISTKFDQYRTDTDKRLNDLEQFKAAQVAQDANASKIDVQKIILAAFGLVSTVVAIAMGFYKGFL